jgi:hypothetical protein
MVTGEAPVVLQISFLDFPVLNQRWPYVRWVESMVWFKIKFAGNHRFPMIFSLKPIH